MCDFSLESVKSRAAVDAEDLIVHRFESGCQGLVDPLDEGCAVCCKSGVEMTLFLDAEVPVITAVGPDTLDKPPVSRGPGYQSDRQLLFGETPVVFRTLGRDWNVLWRDGVTLPGGHWLSLQNIPVGTKVTVIKVLPKELTDALKVMITDHIEWLDFEVDHEVCV